jgi:glycosyltransferase involved in cell wall biosynthesis
VCGVDLLVKAFGRVLREFPDATLELAGDGPDRPNLERLAAPFAARVRFLGFLPPEELTAHYARATVMVNANRDDNHPNSVLEAMAAGVPVVATAVGGVPYLITDGETGFLVPPEDEAALAAKIVYVLTHSAAAAAAAARAREAVKEFMWPYERPGHLRLLTALAGMEK